MVCKYFIDDYFGFCGATAYSHVPRISEMEQLCFKNCYACRIYNEYERSHVPVGGTPGTEERRTKMKKQFGIGIVGSAIMIALLISAHEGAAFAQGGKMKTGDYSAQTISFGRSLPQQNAAPAHRIEEILEGDTLSAMEHNGRGIMYSEKGRYDLALEEFNKALEIYPLSVEIYNNRGITYLIRGDYDRAIEDFTKAVMLNPDAAKTYYNRGITYVAKGQINRALSDLEKCLELDPANASAHEARGIMLAALACSDWGSACRFGNCGYIKKAVEIGLCVETTNNPLVP